MILLPLIPIYFAGMLNWVYDMSLLKPHLLPDNFNPHLTDENKYHKDLLPYKKAWHNGWGALKYSYKEKFIGSPTYFVFLTDWFHAIQMLQRVMWVTGFAIAAVAPTPDWHWFWIIVVYIKASALVYGAGFHTSRILNGWLRTK